MGEYGDSISLSILDQQKNVLELMAQIITSLIDVEDGLGLEISCYLSCSKITPVVPVKH